MNSFKNKDSIERNFLKKMQVQNFRDVDVSVINFLYKSLLVVN